MHADAPLSGTSEQGPRPAFLDAGEQAVYQLAADAFARADAEDRARACTKATARTFYAASVFFDALAAAGGATPSPFAAQIFRDRACS